MPQEGLHDESSNEREIQSFAQLSSVLSTLQSCIVTQSCYISHSFTVVFPLLAWRGRFLTLLCALLSFYLNMHETKGTFFSLSTASHHFCLHLAGAGFYWHWILIGDARETYRSTLNCHLSRTTLIVKSNPWWQIRWCEQWGFRDWSCGKCTNINVVFHWVMTLWKQIVLYV